MSVNKIIPTPYTIFEYTTKAALSCVGLTVVGSQNVSPGWGLPTSEVGASGLVQAIWLLSIRLQALSASSGGALGLVLLLERNRAVRL